MTNTIFTKPYSSPEQRQEAIIALFSGCIDEQAKYQKIIELGGLLPPFPEESCLEDNIVRGCQSIVYLDCKRESNGNLYFTAKSEALISSGLAALAIISYNGLSPQEVLQSNPFFIEKLGLAQSLTPGRSNGLASMITLIKQKALHFLLSEKHY